MSSTKLHSPPSRPGGLSANSRKLSANTLKDRLSMLTTPLNVVKPVAALHANVKCVVSIIHCRKLKFDPLQLRSSFVPAQIPRKRRFQMLAVAVWSVMIVTTASVWLLLWYVPIFTCFPWASLMPLMLYLVSSSLPLQLSPSCCGYLNDDIALDNFICLAPFHHCGHS